MSSRGRLRLFGRLGKPAIIDYYRRNRTTFMGKYESLTEALGRNLHDSSPSM